MARSRGEWLRFNNIVEIGDLRGFFMFTVLLKQRWTVPALLFAFGVGAAVLQRGGAYTWAGAILLTIEFLFLFNRAGAWRRFKQITRGEIGRQCIVSIDNEGLRMLDEYEAITAFYHWRDVTEVYERRRHFFIYLGPVSACILPKRYLLPDQEAQLTRFLRQRYAEKYHFMI